MLLPTLLIDHPASRLQIAECGFRIAKKTVPVNQLNQPNQLNKLLYPASSIIENDRPRPGHHPFQVIQEFLDSKFPALSGILDEIGSRMADE